MTTFLKNRKALFDHEVLEKFDAGIELLGIEVKAIKNNQGKLDGSHITIRGGEALLLNSNIPAYQPNNTPKDYNPLRNRRLLLTKKELKHLVAEEAKRGLTIIPLSMYNKGSKIKLEIAIVRGKKKFDKRETLKKKATEREVRREVKFG